MCDSQSGRGSTVEIKEKHIEYNSCIAYSCAARTIRSIVHIAEATSEIQNGSHGIQKGEQLARNIHTPENKTAADNPSCRNNDPARDNPRIRQRSNSTKSRQREREKNRERWKRREENRIILWTIYWISQTPRALSVIRGHSSITLGEPVNRAKPPNDAVSGYRVISSANARAATKEQC